MAYHHILITGALHPSAMEQFEAASDVRVTYAPDLPYEQILERMADVSALVTRSETKVTQELIDRAPNLKVIARAAVGIGNIDVDYATEKGILVINTPGKNTNSAAELTLGLLLAVMRKVIPAHTNMQANEWNRHRYAGRELMDKTIGIIGLGNVGHRVARFARAFDMKVLAYDPHIADERFEAHHAQKVDLPTLLSKTDVLTVHVPLNNETRDMVGPREFERMKEGVIVINAARGGIINEDALLSNLHSGKVAGAGIDTWSDEPVKDSAFRGMENVVMTPHIGASTAEAQKRIAESIADQTLRALRDEIVDYPVNMPSLEVLGSDTARHYSVLAEKLGSFAMQAMDFNPAHIQALYRGALTSEEGGLVRRAFLKGLLHNTSSDPVTFVNAEKIADERGITMEDVDDPGFSEYPSAIKFIISEGEKEFSLGGVVFGEDNYRLSYVNGFTFEVIPEGHMLLVVNHDRPGVIGDMGMLLSRNGINISQFELSRNMPGGKAMCLIRADSPIGRPVVDQMARIPNVTQARRITL